MGLPFKFTYLQKQEAADELLEHYQHITFKDMIKHIFLCHQNQELTYYLSEQALALYIVDHDSDVPGFNNYYGKDGDREYIPLLLMI